MLEITLKTVTSIIELPFVHAYHPIPWKSITFSFQKTKHDYGLMLKI